MGAHQTDENRASLGAKTLNGLASVKFAVTVVILVAIACLVGTLLPQGASEVSVYLQDHPGASGRMHVLDRLWLTRVYSSPWFYGLLGVLALTITACSMRRFGTVRRTTGFARRRAFGSMISHISMLLILAGAVIRVAWGERGHLELREGETRAQFQADNGDRPLPFGIQLNKFSIETYAGSEMAEEGSQGLLMVEWPAQNLATRFPVTVGLNHVVVPKGETATADNSFRIQIERYVPDFRVDVQTHEVTSRSDEPNNPAIYVGVVGPNYSNHQWLYAKFPDFGTHSADGRSDSDCPLRLVYQTGSPVDGPIKSFKSALSVVEGGRVVETPVVEVNAPFRYKGYTFYQSGYDLRDLSWTSLQVVHDPGVPFVYAGFLLLIAGLFIVFYLNPWIEQRTGAASRHLSAHAPRRPSAQTLPCST